MANPNMIFQWNCVGLKHKRDELDIIISKYNPAVICLQETLTSPNIEIIQQNNGKLPSELNIRGIHLILNVKTLGETVLLFMLEIQVLFTLLLY